MMLQILKLLFDRLWAALACPGGVHYVSGAQSLPPPLTPEEEKQLPCPDDGRRRCRPG